jgi:hypothetical protein
MRSRINAVVILAVALVALTAVSSAKGVQTSRHQLPTAGLMDGPGPMCPPTTGCGNENATAAKATQVRREILLVDGPGPMCPPHTGCGHNQSVTAVRTLTAVLSTDGGGSMRFPSTGAGLREAGTNARWAD